MYHTLVCDWDENNQNQREKQGFHSCAFLNGQHSQAQIHQEEGLLVGKTLHMLMVWYNIEKNGELAQNTDLKPYSNSPTEAFPVASQQSWSMECDIVINTNSYHLFLLIPDEPIFCIN